MRERRIVRITIRGRVQGVGFRIWMRHQAELHGLEGWVRNRRDGAVEALFCGPAEAVEIVLKACRTGPRGSRIEELETSQAGPEALAEAGPEGFRVLPTA